MALSLTQCRWLLHCGLGVTLQTAVASRLLDNPVPPLPVDHHGDQGRKQVGHRLREESGSSAEDCRQQEQGGEVHALAEQRQGQRPLHHPHAGEPVDQGVLEGQWDEANGAYLDGLDRQSGHLEVGSENVGKGGAQELAHQEQHGGKGQTKGQDVLLGLQNAVGAASPKVIAQNGAGRAGDPAMGMVIMSMKDWAMVAAATSISPCSGPP